MMFWPILAHAKQFNTSLPEPTEGGRHQVFRRPLHVCSARLFSSWRRLSCSSRQSMLYDNNNNTACVQWPGLYRLMMKLITLFAAYLYASRRFHALNRGRFIPTVRVCVQYIVTDDVDYTIGWHVWSVVNVVIHCQHWLQACTHFLLFIAYEAPESRRVFVVLSQMTSLLRGWQQYSSQSYTRSNLFMR